MVQGASVDWVVWDISIDFSVWVVLVDRWVRALFSMNINKCLPKGYTHVDVAFINITPAFCYQNALHCRPGFFTPLTHLLLSKLPGQRVYQGQFDTRSFHCMLQRNALTD